MNPYALFGEFIGLVAVVLVFGREHVRRFLDIVEQRVARRSRAAGLSDEASQQIEALRAELVRLRDTSTQYDISIQHTLEELQHRVELIEDMKRPMPLPAEATRQAVSIGTSQ